MRNQVKHNFYGMILLIASKQVKNKRIRIVVRSMEAEYTNYDRVLKCMRSRSKFAQKKDKKS